MLNWLTHTPLVKKKTWQPAKRVSEVRRVGLDFLSLRNSVRISVTFSNGPITLLEFLESSNMAEISPSQPVITFLRLVIRGMIFPLLVKGTLYNQW